MTKICVSGSKGKMGERILVLAKDDPDIEVTGDFDVGQDPEPIISAAECLVDFTSPEATMQLLVLCEKHGKAMVIGTTGLSETQRATIAEASKKITVVFSPNMSIGVNCLFKMVAEAAKVLVEDYEVSVLEAHHIQKKDSPSGTAKELVRIVKEARGGVNVPIESVRESDIVGEHTITFESPFDTIEITHSAKTRDIFAKGALTAARFTSDKKRGLYSMKDVLGIS